MIENKLANNEIKYRRLASKLTANGEKYVQQGHPWVFNDSIVKINDDAKTGDLVIIFGKRKNAMIGIGLYDADSPIRIKVIYSGTKPVTINSNFFLRKIEQAYQKRLPLLRTATNAYRLIFGENDGFPSLIADVYNKVLVIKLYSEIWLPHFQTIVESLIEVSQTEIVVVRLSRSLQNSNSHQFKDGMVIYGILENEVVTFKEHGINFSANVIKGHKTGYFLDHRENRRQVGLLSQSKTVLDVFSYAGGFSVHALANGATEVTSLDISPQALEIAIENGKLNDYVGQHNILAGDAFKLLKQLISEGKTFEVVVIDPPSFAKQQSDAQLAKKKYAQLAELGAKLTTKSGLLVLASCSSRVSAKSFYDINEQTLKSLDRPFSILQKNEHDIDHPIGFPEGAYLKCGYYRFG